MVAATKWRHSGGMKTNAIWITQQQSQTPKEHVKEIRVRDKLFIKRFIITFRLHVYSFFFCYVLFYLGWGEQMNLLIWPSRLFCVCYCERLGTVDAMWWNLKLPICRRKPMQFTEMQLAFLVAFQFFPCIFILPFVCFFHFHLKFRITHINSVCNAFRAQKVATCACPNHSFSPSCA